MSEPNEFDEWESLQSEQGTTPKGNKLKPDAKHRSIRDIPIFKEIQEFFRAHSKDWYATDYIKNKFKITKQKNNVILKTLFEQSDIKRKEQLKDTKIIMLYKWYSEEPHDSPLSARARETLKKRLDAEKEQQKITKDEALSDIIKELRKIQSENQTLKQELENLKQEFTTGEKIKSQSIVVKRMCITVLKQYQNSLTSPLAQDAIELLSYIGYYPGNIIEKIKKSKRK
jgi:hypothetical protein